MQPIPGEQIAEQRKEWTWRAGPPWVVFLLALLAYLPSLGGTFLGDDVQILHNPAMVQAEGWWLCLTESYHYPFDSERNEYRPLTSLTFWAQIQLLGTAPATFHGLNLLLHGLAALALYRLLWLLVSPRAAWLGASLFAVHPVFSEAVNLIVGRADILATLFGLAAWISATRRFLSPAPGLRRVPLAAVLWLVLATFAKESGITNAGAIALTYWLLHDQQHPLRTRLLQATSALAPLLAVPVIVAGLRIALRGPIWYEHGYLFVDNPLVGASLFERWATALWVLLKGWSLFLWPSELSSDYSFDQIPTLRSLTDPRIALAVLPFLVVFVICRSIWAKGHRFPILAVTSYFALASATSNLLLPIGTIFGERLLYLPGIAVVGLLGWSLDQLALFLEKRARVRSRLLAALALLLLATLGTRTANRCLDWQDRAALYTAQAEVAPQSVRTWKNLANLHLESGESAKALEAITQAHQITEDWSDTWLLRAEALELQGSIDEAILSVGRALTLGDHRPGVYLRLAHLMVAANRPDEARRVVQRGLSLHPADPRLHAFSATLPS